MRHEKKTKFDQGKCFHSIHERKLSIEDAQIEITEIGEKKKWKTLVGYIIVCHDNKLIEKKPSSNLIR